uniref:Zinc finger protein 35 n=1 Tax=Iconisemion striatum TaxID=60296 RepID=A0A1A7YIH5_9TELE
MNMATCVPFQSQLSSIMEVLVKAAVAEISKLVDDKCAILHLEISRKQSENELLTSKLRMMENKNAQMQREFENYMDRGTDLGRNSLHPTRDIKFSGIEEAGGSFIIKEESADEALWISDSARAVGNAVHYPDSDSGPENQQLAQSEIIRQKCSEISDSYNSGPHVVDINGLHFTVKTEKEEDRVSFRQDGCQHVGGKQAPIAADYPMDERENQLWSSIIEGNDIDTGFPDFSSVVDEYSGSFSEHSDATNVGSNTNKPPGVQQCNGFYSGEFQKDPQLSHFQPRTQTAALQSEKQKEQIHLQRNTSRSTQIEEEPQNLSENKPVLSESLNTFTPANFYSHTAHKSLSAITRVYTCSLCGKSFNRLHQFKLHLQSHKRRRALWCTVCGKSFQCPSHLSIHHRTHTGEKPYGCGQCGKRFTQQSSLRVHQRTHSGERPYSCSQCGKTFILMHHLKRHGIIHTNS